MTTFDFRAALPRHASTHFNRVKQANLFGDACMAVYDQERIKPGSYIEPLPVATSLACHIEHLPCGVYSATIYSEIPAIFIAAPGRQRIIQQNDLSAIVQTMVDWNLVSGPRVGELLLALGVPTSFAKQGITQALVSTLRTVGPSPEGKENEPVDLHEAVPADIRFATLTLHSILRTASAQASRESSAQASEPNKREFELYRGLAFGALEWLESGRYMGQKVRWSGMLATFRRELAGKVQESAIGSEGE